MTELIGSRVLLLPLSWLVSIQCGHVFGECGISKPDVLDGVWKSMLKKLSILLSCFVVIAQFEQAWAND
jgi:hypothetical protein